MEQLRARLRQRQRVPVAVAATPAAEAVLGRSGLSVLDLLRPVSLVNNLNGEEVWLQLQQDALLCCKTLCRPHVLCAVL
jgi:hypothetical protein